MCTLLAPSVWLVLGLLLPAPVVDDPKPPPPTRDEIDAAIDAIEEARDRDDLPEAERLTRELLDSLDPNDDDNELARLWCLGALVSIMMDLDQPGEALPILSQELEVCRARHGPDHAETALAMVRLAAAHYLLNDFPSAEKVYRDALPKLEDAYGKAHLEVGRTLASLGIALIQTDQYDEAEQVLRRSLAILEDEYGPDDFSLAVILNQLGWLRYQAGDLDESEMLCRRAVDLATRDDSPPDSQLAAYLNNLAHAVEDRRDFAEARALRERALAFAEETFGPEHSETIYTGCYLGRTLALGGIYAKSEAAYRRALDSYEAAAIDDPGLLSSLLTGLGATSLYLDHLDQAELLWLRALALQEDVYGPSHPELVNTLQLLVFLSERRSNPDQAADYRSRAAEILELLQDLPPHDDEPDIDF